MFPIPTPKLTNPNPALPSNQTYIQIWMDPFLTHHLLPPHPHQIRSKEPGQKVLSLLQHSELQNHPLFTALPSHPFSAPPSLCHCLHWLASKVLNFLLVGTSESQDASSAISLFPSLPLLVSTCLPSTTLYSPSFLGYLPSPCLSLELTLPCCYIKAIWTFLHVTIPPISSLSHIGPRKAPASFLGLMDLKAP